MASEAFDFSEPPSGQFWVLREAVIGGVRISYGVQAEGEGGGVKLYSLRTPHKQRGLGLAREAMTQLLAEVDRVRKIVCLDASPLDSKTILSKLIGFYESFGFELTGRSANVAGDPEMKRLPFMPAPAIKRGFGAGM